MTYVHNEIRFTFQRKNDYVTNRKNVNFANIKIQPFFAILPNLLAAKFSRYTVQALKHSTHCEIEDLNRENKTHGRLQSC